MNKIFSMNHFKLKYIFRRGFWIICLAALSSILFSTVTYWHNKEGGEAFSIGRATPIDYLRNQGYRVSCAGYICGKMILYYQQEQTNERKE